MTEDVLPARLVEDSCWSGVGLCRVQRQIFFFVVQRAPNPDPPSQFGLDLSSPLNGHVASIASSQPMPLVFNPPTP